MTTASTTESRATPAVRISWPHLVLAIIGFAISGYALYAHALIKRGQDAGCGMTETISCDKVLGSAWGELFGIPLGAFGMAFFVIVLLTAITTDPRTTGRQAAIPRLLVAGVGFLTSVGLSYVSLVLIKAACPVCLATHATTFALLLASLWEYFRTRKAQSATTL